MNDSKPNKTTTAKQTETTFLKRIKELDIKEQEQLLKLYTQIIKDIKL